MKRFTPVIEELEDRRLPSGLRTLLALVADPGTITPDQAAVIRRGVQEDFQLELPRGSQIEVSFLPPEVLDERAPKYSHPGMSLYVGRISSMLVPKLLGVEISRYMCVAYAGTHAAAYADPVEYTRELRETLSHEIGHAMGLDHPAPSGQEPWAIMNGGEIVSGAVFQGYYEQTVGGGVQNESLWVSYALGHKRPLGFSQRTIKVEGPR